MHPLVASFLALGLFQAQTQPTAPLSNGQREATLSPALRQQLAQMRANIARNRYSYKVGATEVFGMPIEQITGALPLDNAAEIARQQEALNVKVFAADKAARDAAIQRDPTLRDKISGFNQETTPEIRRWDWRKAGKVTAVRSQNPAGTCWIFSVIGAFESSWFIRNNQISDVSEQFIVSYGNAGSSNGGWPTLAAKALTSLGTVTEVTCPYTATNTTPTPHNIFRPYRALTWGFVPAATPLNPTVKELKEAILKYGPVVTSIIADNELKGYTGGVFDHVSTKTSTNHCVVIIGWDDDKESWIIKNSWGWGWGETCGYGASHQMGYGYIKYGHHKIGTDALWVMANSIHYTVPPQN